MFLNFPDPDSGFIIEKSKNKIKQATAEGRAATVSMQRLTFLLAPGYAEGGAPGKILATPVTVP